MRQEFELYLNQLNAPKNTVQNKKSGLKRFNNYIDNQDVEDIDKFLVKGWITEMNEEIFDSTIRNHFYTLSSFFKWAEKWGTEHEIQINTNPCGEIDLKRDCGIETDPNKQQTRKQRVLKLEEPHYLSIGKVETMLENVPAPTVRNELVIRTLYETGVRRSELVNIQIEDIDMEQREIRIYSKKTDNHRSVFYRSLNQLLRMYLDGGYRDESLYAEDSPYLFVTRQSDQLSTNRVGDIVSNAAENAGIQSDLFPYISGNDSNDRNYRKVTPHTLRHTFAVHALHEGEQSVDLETLRRVMGHESLETTREYLHIGQDKIRERMHMGGPSTNG